MPEELDPMIPNGVIIAPKPEDYMAGDGNLGGITQRVLVEDNDWTRYKVKGKRQSGNGYDTNNCTGFGYCNDLAMQYKAMMALNLIPVTIQTWLQVNGYIDENGELALSMRALGTMAGTSHNGNSLNKVADTARTMGLIPYSKWPNVFTNDNDYYKALPAELVALAKEFLQHFDLPYEYVSTPTYGNEYQAAPLYVALATCFPWNATEPPPVAWCGVDRTNHCLVDLKRNSHRVFDSYQFNENFTKDLAADYSVPAAYRVLLILKGQTNMILVKDTKSSTVGILTGNKDKRILAFSNVEALGLLGDEPQTPLDFTGIPVFNIVKNDPAHPGQFLIVNK